MKLLPKQFHTRFRGWLQCVAQNNQKDNLKDNSNQSDLNCDIFSNGVIIGNRWILSTFPYNQKLENLRVKIGIHNRYKNNTNGTIIATIKKCV